MPSLLTLLAILDECGLCGRRVATEWQVTCFHYVTSVTRRQVIVARFLSLREAPPSRFVKPLCLLSVAGHPKGHVDLL